MRVLLASTNTQHDTLVAGLAELGILCDITDDLRDLASILSLSGPYQVVVLDSTAPLQVAQGVLRGLRRDGVALPVVVLTEVQPAVEESLLHAGADDVILRPFRVPVLHARLLALARRVRGYASGHMACGNVTLDQEQHAVLVDGRRVPLTAREFDFLQTMMLHKGVLMTKERFMNTLYDVAEAPDLKIVDVFVCKLRRKLAACGAAEMIRTVWGRGHVLAEPTEAAVAAARAVERLVITPDPAPRGWVRRAPSMARA
jgi:two-component system, cell cycle response regulator CtrA